MTMKMMMMTTTTMMMMKNDNDDDDDDGDNDDDDDGDEHSLPIPYITSNRASPTARCTTHTTLQSPPKPSPSSSSNSFVRLMAWAREGWVKWSV